VSICSSNGTHARKCRRLFQTMWPQEKGKCPPVDYVFTISNSYLQSQFESYSITIRVANIEEHFHGTTLKCNLARDQSLCLNRSCGICSISRYGFDSSLIGSNVSFQRFGAGFYLAPNSSKCHDYTQGSQDSGHRALLLCEVYPGEKHRLQTTSKHLTAPPVGRDCVYGDAGQDLNYAEIVLYKSESILPKHIILYKLNGIHKLVK